jgi:regulator of cell morphogenesis and NO signaling
LIHLKSPRRTPCKTRLDRDPDAAEESDAGSATHQPEVPAMNAKSAWSPTLQSTVAEVAGRIPGAAATLRQAGIDIDRDAAASLAEAAAAKSNSAAELVARLNSQAAAVRRAAPEITPDLIAHILQRYHEAHRTELPGLVALAEKVERVHADHPDAPRGLARLLTRLQEELAEHMAGEEQALFQAMRMGGDARLGPPLAAMRHDHDEYAGPLQQIERLTHGFRLPEGACRSWQALYAGTRKFAEDLVTHIYLESAVLFPRFEPHEPAREPLAEVGQRRTP